MRMNVLYITLLGSDAQGSRGSFCKNYVIKMIKRQSFRAYTESINTRCFVLTYLSSMEYLVEGHEWGKVVHKELIVLYIYIQQGIKEQQFKCTLSRGREGV
jgi:hypothetical protein